MKTTKQLRAVYDSAKGDKSYYSFERFTQDAKDFIKAIKRGEVVASMHVSSSGMTRRFNSVSYNMLWNICYNQKFSWDKVKVVGCGMDMWWNLNYVTASTLMKKEELEKHGINGKCSNQRVI